jgi:aspartyl-tRNA(Asn)/glutamyl-tRNA(Gln) amidotransferase subunit B
MLSAQKDLASFFEETVAICNNPKEVSNRLLGDMLRMLNDTGLTISQSSITPEKLALLIEKTEKKLITRQKSKEIFEKAFTEMLDIEQYIKDNGLESINDTSAVSSAVKKIIDAYPDSVTEYLNGKTKVFGFLVGQTMRELKGRADPATVNNTIKDQLNLLQNKS